jgi:hypothetical protein
LLFAVPKMGRLFASCGSDTAFRLTYTANRDQGEHVVALVGKVVVKRQDLDPSRSLSFSVKVTPKPMGSSVVHESPAVELTASVNGEPFDGRSVERFKLANAADQTGECVAESAVVRVATHFHFG